VLGSWNQHAHVTQGIRFVQVGGNLELTNVQGFSEHHAAKLVKPKDGMHCFSPVPVITAEMWKEAQQIDVSTLQLSFVVNEKARRAWGHLS
jgi:hypothetical protein